MRSYSHAKATSFARTPLERVVRASGSPQPSERAFARIHSALPGQPSPALLYSVRHKWLSTQPICAETLFSSIQRRPKGYAGTVAITAANAGWGVVETGRTGNKPPPRSEPLPVFGQSCKPSTFPNHPPCSQTLVCGRNPTVRCLCVVACDRGGKNALLRIKLIPVELETLML